MERNTLPEQDLLADIEDTNVRASTGKRLGNYIIDLVFFYAFVLMVGFVWAIISPNTIDSLDSSGGFGLEDRLFTLVLYALFMFGQEALTKGSSLGKLITGTKAVNLDGSSISTSTALARGFSRAVPFCVFSAFGNPCNPWQDKWTNTMVIDKKLSSLG